MPDLLHGLEALPLNKPQLSFLDFMVYRFLMKLFTISDMRTTEFCRLHFNSKLPSEQLGCGCKKFASSEFVSINLAYCSTFYFYKY